MSGTIIDSSPLISNEHFIDSSFFKSLKALEQAVRAFQYLADNSFDEDSDYSIKQLLAKELTSSYEKLYLESISTISPHFKNT